MWYHTQVDTTSGRLAQLVEHLLDVQEVTGSSPVPSTIQFVLEPDSLRKKVRVRFCLSEVCASNRTVNEQRQGITMMVVPCLCYYKFSKSKGVREVSGRLRFLWTISPSSLRCGRRSWQGGHRKCYATQRTQRRGWLPADTVQSGQRPEKWPDRSSAYRPRWKLHGT